MPTPVLHLVAGPNGAGKSTLVAAVVQPVTHLPFVNADVIAAERWPDSPVEHAYDASRTAALERDRLLERRASFITETVFSHGSKLDLVTRARSLGFLVELHVVMVPVELSVARVASRAAQGGHDVPETKIRERHARLWSLVASARTLADTATFYDNSRAARPFRIVATYRRGRVVAPPAWPRWAPEVLLGGDR